ncbi:MAG: GMC family oxidoreductase [Geminicoccaceae bacterium]
MILDMRSQPSGQRLEYDLCLIGAGAAGLTIANALRDSGLRICVLEGGGLEIDAESQALYEGANIGLPYFPLDVCRLRYFGGTTGHWAGICRPVLGDEMGGVAWLERDAWPIRPGDLEPYQTQAAAQIGLPTDRWDNESWERQLDAPLLPVDPALFHSQMFLMLPTRMGPQFEPVMKEAGNVHVWLNANVVDLELSADGTRCSAVAVRTLSGIATSVVARIVVVCAGGIENARLLLACNRVQASGIGNAHDQVGRYFTDHPAVLAGSLVPTDPHPPLRFYDRVFVSDYASIGHLLLTDETMRRQQLVLGSVRLDPVDDPDLAGPGLDALRSIKNDLYHGRFPDDLAESVAKMAADISPLTELAWHRLVYGQAPVSSVDVRVAISPAPNPDSRVMLGEQRDPLGMPRVVLDWRLSEIDRRTFSATVDLFAREAGRLNLGRVKKLIDDSLDWNIDIEGVGHAICTTRMSSDPRHGVVDRDCRIWGMDNIYVAGSSVFSTPPGGTPTLLLVTLALRLADHLRQRLA